jgi:mRNA-degrading endonuclease RelE of RelBE toxin-antitoxin system/uncharacterized membrane-anchored protein YhcB (DUF1043 family)
MLQGMNWAILIIGTVIFGWITHWLIQLQRQNQQLRRQLRDRQENMATLHQVLRQRDDQVQTEQERSIHFQKLAENYQQRYSHFSHQITQLIDQIKILRSTLQENRNHDDYVGLLETDNQTLNDRCSNLDLTLQQTQQDLTQMQHQTAIEHEQVIALEAEKEALSQQLKEVSHRLQICQAQQAATEENSPLMESAARYTLRIDCWKDLNALQNKPLRQLMKRITELQTDPRPHDCHTLNRYIRQGILSLDMGEYRICYRVQDAQTSAQGEIEILLVGKRNDHEVYDRLLRRLT